MRAPSFLALGLLAFSSCGTTLGRVPFAYPGESRTVVNLDANQAVLFWSDVDIKFQDQPRASFAIELWQEGRRVAQTTCNAIVHKGGSVCLTRFAGRDEWSANCEMHCTANVPRSGPTEVRATLIGSGDDTQRIERADLIVKQ